MIAILGFLLVIEIKLEILGLVARTPLTTPVTNMDLLRIFILRYKTPDQSVCDK